MSDKQNNKGLRAAIISGVTLLIGALGLIGTLVGLATDIPELVADRPFAGETGEVAVTLAPTTASGEVATPLPTLTPTPTPFAPDTSALDCDLDSEYVQDLTIPDGSGIPVGASFEKVWQVRNTGDCTWNANYRVEIQRGNAFTITEYFLVPEEVPPGESAELHVVFTLKPDTRVGSKQTAAVELVAPHGETFGERPSLEIAATQGG